MIGQLGSTHPPGIISSPRTTDISGVNIGKVNFSWCWGGAVVHDDVHSDIVVVTV